jgi:hypothetical protein
MCDCIEKLNKDLAENHPELNTRIHVPIVFNFEKRQHVEPKAIILTEKIDGKKRKKAITLFATYCPFCGKEYKET